MASSLWREKSSTSGKPRSNRWGLEKIMLIIFNAFRLCVQGLHPCQGFCCFHIYARKNHCLPHQIMENAEINNIIKIIGLQYKKNYSDPESLKTLRYGKIMIMTDQVCQQLKSQKCILLCLFIFFLFLLKICQTWFEKFTGFDLLLNVINKPIFTAVTGSRWLPYQRPVDQLHPS